MIAYKIRDEDSAETKVCKIAINMLEDIVGRKSEQDCERCKMTRALVLGALIDIGEIEIDLE